MAEKTIAIEYVRLDKLKPYGGNPRKIEPAEMQKLRRSIKEYGFVDPIIARKSDNMVIGGHQRIKAAELEGIADVPVVYVEFEDDKAAMLNIALNKISGEWDWPKLGDLFEGFDTGDIDMEMSGFDEQEIEELMAGLDSASGDIVEDEVPEPPDDPISKTGDLWLLGEHRLLCGDSTKSEDVERLMGGEKAELCHADPPYGMGKEKEGIVNDNLYREKLDTFQMDWWRAVRPRIKDNGSVYIWGISQDLWRLWYRLGGLNDSERMTLRNEIVWDKSFGLGMGSSQHRMYPTASERCLFFMLGEQGFNNNADNYWEGWEPIRAYLAGERKKMGWDIPTMKRIAGHSDLSRDHWTGKSQWTFITKDVYLKLQEAAKKDGFKKDYDGIKKDYDGFKKDYDELKKDFYSTRAYFDNAHENMTDVWRYDRVSADERHGHATPKPVKMIARAVKTSCPESGITYEPFLGSGSTLIAAEQLNRKCYAMEIEPKYVDVAVTRWENLTNKKAVLEEMAVAV